VQTTDKNQERSDFVTEHLTNQKPGHWPSINAAAAPLVERLVGGAASLRIGVEKGPKGCTVVDCGIEHPGGLEAGLLVTEICMGGLGSATLQPVWSFARWPWTINIHSSNPVLSCLGSQYAGWNLTFGDFSSLGSGPARALAGREDLFQEFGYQDKADTACLVLEVDKTPPQELVEKVSADCSISAQNLTLVLTPTTSLAGNLQVVGRVLEVAMHKIHELHFPLERIIDGMASAPVPPVAGNFLAGMGRTNDAIIYGGTAHLFVSGPDDDVQQLANDLPSSNSRDYGKPFEKTFKAVKGDFYAIDGSLFSPARVIVTAMESGRSFHAGEINEDLLNTSFGYDGT
jgi:methenyltetrahydromethanopterin cyclohydrolase